MPFDRNMEVVVKFTRLGSCFDPEETSNFCSKDGLLRGSFQPQKAAASFSLLLSPCQTLRSLLRDLADQLISKQELKPTKFQVYKAAAPTTSTLHQRTAPLHNVMTISIRSVCYKIVRSNQTPTSEEQLIKYNTNVTKENPRFLYTEHLRDWFNPLRNRSRRVFTLRKRSKLRAVITEEFCLSKAQFTLRQCDHKRDFHEHAFSVGAMVSSAVFTLLMTSDCRRSNRVRRVLQELWCAGVYADTTNKCQLPHRPALIPTEQPCTEKLLKLVTVGAVQNQSASYSTQNLFDNHIIENSLVLVMDFNAPGPEETPDLLITRSCLNLMEMTHFLSDAPLKLPDRPELRIPHMNDAADLRSTVCYEQRFVLHLQRAKRLYIQDSETLTYEVIWSSHDRMPFRRLILSAINIQSSVEPLQSIQRTTLGICRWTKRDVDEIDVRRKSDVERNVTPTRSDGILNVRVCRKTSCVYLRGVIRSTTNKAAVKNEAKYPLLSLKGQSECPVLVGILKEKLVPLFKALGDTQRTKRPVLNTPTRSAATRDCCFRSTAADTSTTNDNGARREASLIWMWCPTDVESSSHISLAEDKGTSSPSVLSRLDSDVWRQAAKYTDRSTTSIDLDVKDCCQNLTTTETSKWPTASTVSSEAACPIVRQTSLMPKIQIRRQYTCSSHLNRVRHRVHTNTKGKAVEQATMRGTGRPGCVRLRRQRTHLSITSYYFERMHKFELLQHRFPVDRRLIKEKLCTCKGLLKYETPLCELRQVAVLTTRDIYNYRRKCRPALMRRYPEPGGVLVPQSGSNLTIFVFPCFPQNSITFHTVRVPARVLPPSHSSNGTIMLDSTTATPSLHFIIPTYAFCGPDHELNSPRPRGLSGYFLAPIQFDRLDDANFAASRFALSRFFDRHL
ncbi:hypothetical protein CLF_102013 [Clonorchis sinensis]|uniref:Uncharacterized protein n=1 Tax=Clonorchis sinensis TaxID=79923 RepID=G7Y735_CLOSI|nr:hypothetical protein CLF_102013 [Clonorchis sinensis]